MLDAGPEAALSHRTAAGLLSYEGFSPTTLEVTTPRGTRRRTRAPRTYRLHESTDLRSFDVEVVDRLPRTTAVRTFIDLGASASYFEVERAFDDAVRRGIVTVAAVRQRYLEVARQGRRGCGAIGRVLRRDDPTATRSNTFEKLALAAIRAAGLPDPVAQHPVDGPWGRYWIDLAWPERRLGIECDSIAFHGTARQLQHDDTRQNRLVVAGWTILRYTWDDAKRRPHVIAAEASEMLDALPTVA